ncbi:MAG: rhodanese-like domain-containing protein [Chitinophagales bacterium]|nr:rhodanese-like domain-containing protein [Bacteroidota bacterium]
MFSKIKEMLGLGAPTDYKQLLKNGAVIIDVRTNGEFASGHIKGSKNIPLTQLSKAISTLDTTKPIITCCASGIRSAQAKAVLKSNGFAEVYNGGGWRSLQGKLQ